ncbi:MAG: hypothetical protein JSV91_08485 [Phycisphaerales bacterium]|nr:MAG: hypothetical protein JSV91_08485 [Phycisphaerales bacterium]
MNALRNISAVAVLASLTSVAAADAPLVWCTGWVCGGSGPRSYSYFVDSVSYPMMEFRVGTNDLDPEHYLHVLIPEGWQFGVEQMPTGHAHGLHAGHGEMSDGPCYCLTAGSVHWWTDDPDLAVEQFTFGFDHVWPPEDISWILTTHHEDPPEDFIFFEDWDNPVGWGYGPLHGPCAPFEFCWIDNDCDPEHYCFYAQCDADTGWCMPLPVDCPEVWEPVCGCDGVTYANACEAARAGMSIEHAGKCEGFCPEDVDDNGKVEIDDIFQILAAWGPCNDCVEDINDDGVVDIDDVFEVLGAWGPCL